MKILFIGNSHTYMNDMPELVREMVENATGKTCEVFMLAYSGRSLKWHMNEEYFSERFNILHGGYDFCVIQEQAHPMPDETDTIANASRIIELCKKSNTVPVIFETWAEKDKPENQEEMNRRYRNLAKNQGALLAPIGEIWSAAKADLQERFDADLYFSDGAHASPTGDYLIALTLTKVMTGKMPSSDFLKSFDYSFPDSEWRHIKENIADEIVQVPPQVSDTIRKYIALSDQFMGGQ